MKTKFFTFFSLVGLTGFLSICDSWILQYQLHESVTLTRSALEACLLLFVLYLLWRRSTPSYLLAVLYLIGYAALYGYELAQFFVLGNQQAQLPIAATVLSIALVLSAVAALILFAFDYLDYRKQRVPDNF